MDIRLLAGQYKSIAALEWTNIPRFALVTGSNGSGKTQLLEMIARYAGLNPPPPGGLTRASVGPEPFDAVVQCSLPLNGQNTTFLRSHWELPDTAVSMTQIRDTINNVWSSRDRPPAEDIWNNLWLTLQQTTGRSRSEFDRAAFDAALPPNFLLMQEGGVIQPAAMPSAIPGLFLSYAVMLHYFLLEGGTREDFVALHGEAPWLAVSRVLQSTGLRYEAVAPTLPKASLAMAFEPVYRLQLRSLDSSVLIPPISLSSGERVVFLTALWSYFFTTSALASGAALLLLDEPDAHLHPALTSVFLKVVREELVLGRGIRVIATTHSPSTVALTEAGELFVMDKAEPRLRPVLNKWDAVSRLTAGLVTVGTQTKAVFVEDRDDATFFSGVQRVLSQRRPAIVGFDGNRTLNFIPSSTGRGGGGKQTVLGWVADIDSTQVAGIVDRDDDLPPAGRVYAGDRRHLESYLVDPLYLYALLLDENVANRPNVAPGVDHRHSKSMEALDRETLQAIADGMVALYSEMLGGSGDESCVDVLYLNGIVVSLPQWILESDMKRLLRPISERFNIRQDQLLRKYEVLGIVPTDLASMLIRIQQA